MVGSEYLTAIAQPRDKTLIRLSKTTHNLFTFKASEISSNNSEKAYWQINTSSHFSYSLLIQFKLPNVHSHGRQTRKDPVRKSSNLQILSSATSTQTHNHETTPQKCHISKQHSKQAKRGREVERNYKIPANPVFINPGLNGTVLKFDLRYGAPQGSCLGLLLFTVQRTV